MSGPARLAASGALGPCGSAAQPGPPMAKDSGLALPHTRAVVLESGTEIGPASAMTREGEANGLSRSDPASRAVAAAGTVTRSLVGRTVAAVERDLILDTLDHCRGNRTHAARILGISIRTLRNKLNEYDADGVAVPEPGQPRGAAA
jgi:two-component system, response regulator FlrC